ncbi:ABC transporter permease [Pseudofrankia sp. BMG5.37]|nr:ABC transporter permease [Pseudofrankia sp. BMG5.37]MDT3442875.1 ABC transporter permease [Pseudofrankia sp. BMG5.37]
MTTRRFMPDAEPARVPGDPVGVSGLALFVRRFLADYARNPVNLPMLVLVPTVFVVVVAGSLGDAAKLLGGPGGLAVQTATAGWAAGFLTAVAMYFQTRAAHAADRRLVLAGLAPARLVAARLASGLVLALLAAATALVTLLLRAGIDNPGRTIAGTLMFAVIYLAIGAVIGAIVHSPVNGMVLILFVWIVDVFFGPAMGAADRLATRVLPTHFLTLWMVDLPSGHSGRIGDLGIALIWTAGALAVAFTVVTATSRIAGRRRPGHRPGSVGDQLAAGLRMGFRDCRRIPVLWVLLVVVPTVFILLATPPPRTGRSP